MNEWVVLIFMKKLYNMRVRAKTYKEGDCRKILLASSLPFFMAIFIFF